MSSPVTGDATRSRRPNPFVAIAAVLVVAAAGLAIWYGIAWARNAGDDNLSVSLARDEVGNIGRQAVITFNTLDYREVDKGLDQWLNSSTGALHEEVKTRRESSKQAIAAAKTVTTAKVLQVAVIELNEHEGKAVIIASVRVEVTPEGKAMTPKYLRIQGSLERTDQGWKLSGIGQVPFTPAG